MYKFPSLVPRELGPGFNDPQSMCSDAKGNVWLANAGLPDDRALAQRKNAENLNRYDGYPVACDVDLEPAISPS